MKVILSTREYRKLGTGTEFQFGDITLGVGEPENLNPVEVIEDIDFTPATRPLRVLRHRKRKVQAVNKEFPCTEEGCGRSFRRAAFLASHQRVHEPRTVKRGRGRPRKSV